MNHFSLRKPYQARCASDRSMASSPFVVWAGNLENFEKKEQKA